MTFIQAAVFGAVAPKRVATDSNDVAVWTLNESAAPFANSGSGSATSLTVLYGSSSLEADVGADDRGEFDSAIAMVASLGPRLSTSTAVPEPTSTITVSFWVWVWDWSASGWGRTVYKMANPGAWASPFVVLAPLEFSSTGDGSGAARILTVGGTGSNVVTISAGAISKYAWHHVGLTYNGSIMRLYIDGSEYDTASTGTGNIDWDDNGEWVIGSPPGLNSEHIYGMIDDVRIADVVRDATWFADVWTKGHPGG